MFLMPLNCKVRMDIKIWGLMEIASSTVATTNMSVLKSANEQPRLASELISKTIEGLMQAQAAQTSVQPVASVAASGTGTLVNTIA